MFNQCRLPPGNGGYSSRTKRVLESGGELIRVGCGGGGCLLKLSTQSCMLPSTYIKEQRFITMQMTIHGACQGVNYMPTYQRSYMTK